MRHADNRTTLDIYSQSDDEDKRAAQKHIRCFVNERFSCRIAMPILDWVGTS